MLICINGDKMNQWEYSDQYLDNFNSTPKANIYSVCAKIPSHKNAS